MIKCIDYGRLAGIGSITLGTGIGIHIYQSNSWWRDQSSGFRFINDWKYALWIDKIGHFYGSNLLAHAFSAAYEGANFTYEDAVIYAAISALAFELYVEIEDGFGAQWGFSPGDAAANLLGSSYSVAQYYYPVLKNFQPRASYYPSEKFRAGAHEGGNIIDDYEGQKYWMGIRVKEFLPKEISSYWPSFLMISAGMGVSNLDGAGGGQREFYLALDLDVEEIPLFGPAWQFVKNTLNYYHFPMPGIRLYPNPAIFLIVY